MKMKTAGIFVLSALTAALMMGVFTVYVAMELSKTDAHASTLQVAQLKDKTAVNYDDHEASVSSIAAPEVPHDLWKEWPLLAVLAGVIFFQCNLILVVIIVHGRKMDKLTDRLSEFGQDISSGMSAMTASNQALITMCHSKVGKSALPQRKTDG